MLFAFKFTLAALGVAVSLMEPAWLVNGAEPNPGPQSSAAADTNSFPDLNEVFQGRVFANQFDRDVFFLRSIRRRYPAHWTPLLAANIIVTDYVLAPDKLRRFVEELGTATAGTDDLPAVINLAAILSDPAFYANTNAYRPGILETAASALIQIGPRGRQALAVAFSQRHYRTDPVSLEVLADSVGKSGVSDRRLLAALANTAFTFTATNGGYYPRCTREASRNLLLLPGGTDELRKHLNAQEVLADPGRFQQVVEAITAAHAVELSANLTQVEQTVAVRLKVLPNSAGLYGEDLSALQVRLKRALEQLRGKARNN